MITQQAPNQVAPVPVSAKTPTFLLIQVLRAVAALMVVCHHALGLVVQNMHLPEFEFFKGAAGVDIFFVISGFVMMISSRALVTSSHPARVFLLRRIERIVPLYWIATTLKIVLLSFAFSSGGRTLGSAWHVVSSYLFLPTFNPVNRYPVLIVGWTLNYEMFFYALFAVALGMRLPPVRVLAPILACLFVASQFSHSGTVLFSENDGMVLEFLFGMLLAQAVLSGRRPGPIAGGLFVVLGFAAIFCLHPAESLPRALVRGVPASAIVAGAVGLERKLGVYVPRWVLLLGEASYALYLIHGFILQPFSLGLKHVSANRAFGVGFAVVGVIASVVAACTVYWTIEVPLQRYFKQRRSFERA